MSSKKQDDAVEDMIERFITRRRAHGDEMYCPMQRATISRRECAERHKTDHTTRWFGGKETDAIASPQDKKCNGCSLGALNAEQLGVKQRKRKMRRRKSEGVEDGGKTSAKQKRQPRGKAAGGNGGAGQRSVHRRSSKR